MKKTILKLWALVAVCFCTLNVSAQYATDFQVAEVEDYETSVNIDTSVSSLLTAFNCAQANGATPDLSNLNIADDIKVNIGKLWQDCPFRCMETELVERAILTPRKEFQIRNIPLVMMPIEGESKDISWKKYQEGVITINQEGQITDFHLAIDTDLYISVMNSAKSVEDFEHRQLILEYVERFRNSYNLKDLDFLEQIFSEDALIITGKVVKAVKSDINQMSLNNTKIVYSKQKKEEYLANLARVFKANKRINVLFDEIKVVHHPAKKGFYGVTLKQGWQSDSYSDEGYVFLLWDFTNPEAPQIHVRTWQPDKIDVNTPLPEEEIFSIDDFDLD